MRQFFAALLFGLLLLGGLSVQAQDASESRYQQALTALAQGKLDQAEAHLLATTQQQPNHAGAWLDLALLYCEQGNNAKAQQAFYYVQTHFAPPPALAALIQHYQQQGCALKSPSQPVSHQRLLSYRIGQDSNANLAPSDARVGIVIDNTPIQLQLHSLFRPRSDNFHELAWQQDGLLQSRLQLYVQARQYAQESAQNTLYGLIGWQASDAVQLWLSQLLLGGVTYQQGAYALLSHKLSPHWTAELQLAHLRYTQVSGFDNSQIEPRLRWKHEPLTGHWLEIAPGYLFDKPLDQRAGGERKGLSLQASYHYLSQHPWDAGAQLRWVEQADSQRYGGFWPTIQRDNDYTRAKLWLGYQLHAQQRLALELSTVQLRDTISLFNYNNNSVQLLWQYNIN